MSEVTEGNRWIAVGAGFAAAAVILGAFAAHGLDGILVETYSQAEPREIGGLTVPASYKYLRDFQTGATYHMTHSIGIILTGLAMRVGCGRKWSRAAAWLFVAGIVLFSGSLYVLAVTGITVLGAVAPFGGTAFILGWASLGISAIRSK